MEWTERPIKEIITKSNTIGWYKEDCEICGQGAFLCNDPRCPFNISIAFYENKRAETIKTRNDRNILQKIAAVILNEDNEMIHR